MTLAQRISPIVALAGAVVTAGIATVASGAAPSPGGQSIVFARDDGVYLRVGRNVHRIASRGGAPAWSPDRTRIAFSSGDIYVMRADGSNKRRLTRGLAADVAPAWSPDGRLIAFASNRGNRPFAIYVMRTDGSVPRRVTPPVMQSTSMQPAFSPDGRWLVFAAYDGDFRTAELYRVRVADGRGLKRLTSFGRPGEHSAAHMPSYSPDGKRIAFVLGRQDGSAVWTMNADSTRARALTRHDGRGHATPRFSPDGRALVYTTFNPDASDWTQYDFRIWKIRADGSGRVQIARGWEPDW